MRGAFSDYVIAIVLPLLAVVVFFLSDVFRLLALMLYDIFLSIVLGVLTAIFLHIFGRVLLSVFSLEGYGRFVLLR